MAKRPTSEYPCKQLELYAVLRIALGSYREHITEFGNFKAKYNPKWGNDFEKEINAAAKLPAFQARDEASETAKILLSKKATECGNKWQDLKRYIATTTDWEDLQKPKLEAAGSTIYKAATHGNWEVMKGLLESAKNFIKNNTAVLQADDNMPAGFPAQFNTLKQDYQELYDDFIDKTQDQGQETDEKIIENNRIYKKLVEMLLDGQAIFRNNAALGERFTFASVLKIVRGSKGKIRTIDLSPASKELVKRVVKNSKITNTGQVNLMLASGDAETPGSEAITIPVDGSVPRPDDNSEVTVFNINPSEKGQFTIRITVD